MNTTIIRETIGGLSIGAFWWLIYWRAHSRALKINAPGFYYMKAPSWLTLMCGRPLPSGKLELVNTLAQIGGLALSVIWLPMYWFGLSHSQRVMIYSFLVLGEIFVPMVVYSVIAFCRRRRTK